MRQIVQLLARMTTPDDEFASRDTGYETAEDYADDLSSDRMEDDARALWRLIDMAREALTETPATACLNALASNEPCKPDALKRCTICGFVVDTTYKAVETQIEREK